MDFSFTPEQEAFRETLRDFIKRECPPDLDRRLDDEGRYPFELVDKVVETHMMVATNTSPGGEYSGMTIFMLPMDTPGIRYRRLGKIGSEIIGLFEVFFDDVRVPEVNVMGGLDMANQGWLQLMKQLDL